MSGPTLARGFLAGVCLAAPGPVLSLAGASDARDPVVLAAARVLGLRYVVHALLDSATGRHPAADAAVELLHAGSMVPIAVGSARHRRTAIISATCAAAVAGLDLMGRDR
jgi:hypothetical protein